ncbi:MAG: nuclear transport factor 2 family protein [Bacteroidia bacterium]
MSIEQIKNSENALLKAMQTDDVETLDRLLHKDLQFVIPSGECIGKQDDIHHHKVGLIQLKKIVPSEQTIQINSDTATVTVHWELIGSYKGHEFEGKFRYIRVWKQELDTWQVIAGAGVQIHENK